MIGTKRRRQNRPHTTGRRHLWGVRSRGSVKWFVSFEAWVRWRASSPIVLYLALSSFWRNYLLSHSIRKTAWQMMKKKPMKHMTDKPKKRNAASFVASKQCQTKRDQWSVCKCGAAAPSPRCTLKSDRAYRNCMYLLYCHLYYVIYERLVCTIFLYFLACSESL